MSAENYDGCLETLMMSLCAACGYCSSKQTHMATNELLQTSRPRACHVQLSFISLIATISIVDFVHSMCCRFAVCLVFIV